MYNSRALNFAFKKPEFITIYNAYLNKSRFKYYISVLGGCGVENLGKPAYMPLLVFGLVYSKKACHHPKRNGPSSAPACYYCFHLFIFE